MAFFPGPIEDRIRGSGVFDFDNALFKHLWNSRSQADFMAHMRYYISDHRILWVTLDTS